MQGEYESLLAKFFSKNDASVVLPAPAHPSIVAIMY